MKTNYGYKLFEMDKNGDLYPLFIDGKAKQEVGVWLHAKYVPTKGFAARGGWHLGADVPDAPWLKSYDGTDTGYYKSKWKTGKRVWYLIEYNATNDYNEEVSKLKKKCFVDKVPDNGFYFFREVGKGTWVISSDVRIIRTLSEEERQRIMSEKGYDEVEAFKKYKKAFEKRMRKIVKKLKRKEVVCE